jgi:hypothetical protein
MMYGPASVVARIWEGAYIGREGIWHSERRSGETGKTDAEEVEEEEGDVDEEEAEDEV